jgi:hypothetical protein
VTVSTVTVGAHISMAFKLTYSDGQESDYDDDTVWEVDDGVLKLGKAEGKWSVLLSPSHWAVIELQGKKSRDGDDKSEESDKDEKDDDSEDKDEKADSKSKDDKDKESKSD